MLKNGPRKAFVENGGEIKKRRPAIVRGVLSVTLISVDDLAPANLMGKADPFVILSMKKTRTINKTRKSAKLLQFVLHSDGSIAEYSVETMLSNKGGFSLTNGSGLLPFNLRIYIKEMA